MPDEIVAKDEATYELPPPDQYQAVCVDVIDCGTQVSERWGTAQRKVALVFQLNALNKQGRRFEIASKFTLSMNEKAWLRKFLGQWRGRMYSDAEAQAGIPLDKLCGVNAQVSVGHSEDGKYANIVSVFPLMKGAAKIAPEGYTRSPRWAQKLTQANQAGTDQPASQLKAEVKPPAGGRSTTTRTKMGVAAHAPVDVNDEDFPGSLEETDDDLPF